MRYISLIVVLTLIPIMSFSKLPELSTKQSIDNIRYISKGGKFTYYQNIKGELKVSTNYQVSTVLTGKPNTQYLVTSSDEEDFITILQIEDILRNNWQKADHKIYYSKLGSTEAKLVGNGVSPKIHLNGKFLTFFQYENKQIQIINLINPSQIKSIEPQNNLNPYYIPQISMVTPTDAIFTDINNKGYGAVLMYSVTSKEFEVVYKSKIPFSKIEICYQNENIYIGEFPLAFSNPQSSITEVPLFNNPQFKTQKNLYSVPLPDMGNIICDNERIFFLKTTSFKQSINQRYVEVAELNIKTSEVKVLSNLGQVSDLSKTGNLILANYLGKYYIVKGNNEFTDDSIKEVKK